MKTIVQLTLLAGALLMAGCGARRLENEAMASPDDPAAWEALGDAYMKSGRKERARTAYTRALELSPDDEALREKINATASGREIRRIRKLVLRYPDQDEAWGRAGVMAYEAGYSDLAIQYLQQALSMDPTDGEWLYYLSVLMDQEPYLALAEALVGAYPDDDELVGGVAWTVWELEGEAQKALACGWFEQALAIQADDPEWIEAISQCAAAGYSEGPGAEGLPEPVCLDVEGAALDLGLLVDPEVLEAVGDSLLAGGARDQALAVYERWLAVAPGGDPARAVALLRGESAAAVLEELVARSPESWRAHMALGDHRASVGDREGAEESWREAQRLNPAAPGLQARLQRVAPPR